MIFTVNARIYYVLIISFIIINFTNKAKRASTHLPFEPVLYTEMEKTCIGLT